MQRVDYFNEYFIYGPSTLANQLRLPNRRMSNVNLAMMVDRGTKDLAARQSLDDSNRVLLVPLSGWGSFVKG